MKKVLSGFTGYTESGLESKAQAIIAAMTANPNFPAPVPELTAAVTACNQYASSLSAAINGGKTEVAVKNQKKAELIFALGTLANYVNLTANGNEAVLVSSGFDMPKPKQPSPPLSKPEIIKVSDGVNSGELEVNISTVKGARMYMYEYTEDPLTGNNDWTGQSSTLVKTSFSDLQSGKKYWCRAVAYGINEQLVYSDPVSRIVQ